MWNPGPPPFDGRLIVVGGQSRKVGKSALVVDLIERLREVQWTAVKITPHVKSGCPVRGAGCGCGREEHTFAIRQEGRAGPTGDTCRFLAAGARRAIWLETKEGRLVDALSPLCLALRHAGNVIIESNAIVEFWRPDLCLMVVDPRRRDFKPSAQNALPMADVFVFRSPFLGDEVSHPALQSIADNRKFMQLSGQPLPPGVETLARQLMSGPPHPTLSHSQERSRRAERF
jgi:hypothetical protein